MPVSASTINGLKVTLGGTLEIFEALQKEDNFDFLMTARLNQDALEVHPISFLCGSNKP